MPEQKDLLGQLCYRGSDDELRAVFVNQVGEHAKHTGPRFPSVELHRAIQLWLQRQGWKLQFESADIVVNDSWWSTPTSTGTWLRGSASRAPSDGTV